MGRKLIVTDSGNYLNLDIILLINPDTITVRGKEVSRWNIYISLESQPATVTEDRNPKSYKAVQEWIKRNSLLTEQPRGGDGRFQRKSKIMEGEEDHE